MKPVCLILFLYTGVSLVAHLEAASTTVANGSGKVTPSPAAGGSGQGGQTLGPNNTTAAPSQTAAPTSDSSKGGSNPSTISPTSGPSASASSSGSNATTTPAGVQETTAAATDSNVSVSSNTSSKVSPSSTAKPASNPAVTTIKQASLNPSSGTTQKPNTTTAYVTTQKPYTTTASITTQKLNTTTASVTTQASNTTTATQKPNTTTASVTTQKSNTTTASVTTQKSNTAAASVTTQKSNTTTAAVTTQKPNTTTASVTTQKSNTTTASITTQKPNTTTASVTTQKSNTAAVSVTTQKSNTTTAAVTTQKPNTTTAAVTTQKPNTTIASVTTQAPNTTTASVPTSKSSITTGSASTKVPVISTGGTTKPAPGKQQTMYINEIMLNKQGGFQQIELKLNVTEQVDLGRYAMVMVDGDTSRTVSVTRLETYQLNNGLIMVSFQNDTDAIMKSKGIGVAIYDMSQMTSTFKDDWTVNKDGLVDALVIGTSYEQISDHLVQTLTPGMTPFVLDPSLYGMQRTITRCSSQLVRNTDMFALVNPSMGADNKDKCHHRLDYQQSLALKFQADCKLFDDSSSVGMTNQRHLMHLVTKEVNRKCHCGMTVMHIQEPRVSCCGGTDLSMKFVAPNKAQGEKQLSNYKLFIQSTDYVTVDGTPYKLDKSCYSNCCATPAPTTQDDNSKNIRVTVAVVVTCVLIFLVIVIMVLLYMRRKKSAVYQFRMSRLDEEEDYPMGVGEQDDFVGGQEATFDIKG